MATAAARASQINADKAIDFTLPSFTKPRVRPAAHSLDEACAGKLERAIKLMKELPDEDPHSFYQLQATAHEMNPQVHSSSLFLPFNRVHLLFLERICGKLLGDDAFSLPFWNCDHPEGMGTPPRYFEPSRGSRAADRERRIPDNLADVHRTMIRNAKNAPSFLGARVGRGAGSLEQSLHHNLHIWIDNSDVYGEDGMGDFHTSGRDALFYGLHANVDRMWDVWTRVLGHHNFDDKEWLNAAFYFYDENKQLVRVKVSDVLDTEKLGYGYEPRELPWLHTPPVRNKTTSQTADKDKPTMNEGATTPAEFPLILSSTVSTVVKRTRPKTAPSSEREKADEEEVLVIRDIELEPTVLAKFDVLVNPPEAFAGLTPSAAEFAGSFTNVPRGRKRGAKNVETVTTSLRLGLSDLLKDVGAEDDDTIVVTLVPRNGHGNVKIGGVGIDFI